MHGRHPSADPKADAALGSSSIQRLGMRDAAFASRSRPMPAAACMGGGPGSWARPTRVAHPASWLIAGYAPVFAR